MGDLHPVLLLGIVLQQLFEHVDGFGDVVLLEIEEAGQVVPLLLRQLAFLLEHVDGFLNILQRLVVLLGLVVPLGQQHVGVGIGVFGHIEPLEQGVDAFLPLLLHKIELRDGEARVHLHRDGNVRLRHHVLVGLQRPAVVLTGVVDKRVKVVDVGKLIAVERLLAARGDHVVQDFRRLGEILYLRGSLRLRELFIDLVAQGRGAAGLTLLRLWCRLVAFLRRGTRQRRHTQLELQLRHEQLGSQHQQRD